MKLCNKCKEFKSITHFYSKGAQCKQCLADLQRVYRKAKASSCLDCGAKTNHRNSKRCRDCANFKQRGSGSNFYKTGKYINNYGYVQITGQYDHPNARKDGCISEHTLVMAQLLGRPLFETENVHHKNGIRDDNRPENLELWSTAQPAGQRVEDKIAWAIEFLERYGYNV